MAAVSLFWGTNMATVTSCENREYILLKAGEWRSAFWLIMMHSGISGEFEISFYLLTNSEYVAPCSLRSNKLVRVLSE